MTFTVFGCYIAPSSEDARGPDAPTVHSGGFVDGASSQSGVVTNDPIATRLQHLKNNPLTASTSHHAAFFGVKDCQNLE